MFQDENCLPTSPCVCGRCGRQEGRWSRARRRFWVSLGPPGGLCAFCGGSRSEANNRLRRDKPPTSPKHPGASLTLPCPGEEPSLYSPFLQNYFFSSFLARLGGDLGRGAGEAVAEGLPRPPGAGEHPAVRPRSALPSPRVAQGPLPLHGAQSGALSHRQRRRRVPPRRHHPAARGAALGCAGLPSSIYSRTPVTSGFAARGESQPTRVFLLCL